MDILKLVIPYVNMNNQLILKLFLTQKPWGDVYEYATDYVLHSSWSNRLDLNGHDDPCYLRPVFDVHMFGHFTHSWLHRIGWPLQRITKDSLWSMHIKDLATIGINRELHTTMRLRYWLIKYFEWFLWTWSDFNVILVTFLLQAITYFPFISIYLIA